MKKKLNKDFKDVDFKLPCSEIMWQRYTEYKKRLLSSQSYTPSLYWKQREESFNIRYVEGFVYLNGLYKRDVSKETNIGNLFQKLKVRIEIYYRFFLRKIFFTKSKPPIPKMSTKEEYILNRKQIYNKDYKDTVRSILEEYYDTDHEDVYAKHMDIIRCLEKYLNVDSRNSFVEIGSGSGVLAFFLVNRLGFKKANLIDLPIMIPICFFWLSSVVGEKFVSLPGEQISPEIVYRLWNAGDVGIPDHSIDLAINVTSFQEMNHKLVKEYFQLIKKWLIPKGFFMCVNRWSKATDFWLYPYFLFKNFKTMIFDEVLTSRHSSMSKIIVKKLIRLTNN